MAAAAPLIDAFGRRITYLRLSVTDRCDLRCRYCMAEAMTFLPREQVLSIEELAEVADAFIDRGVTKIRLTGGEPLVRRGVDLLARSIGRRLGDGLDELTLTTNATNLDRYAPSLFDAGVRRINVSLDSRDPDRFRHVTRWGDVDKVLDGMAAAKAAGLRVKINMVALAGLNEDEIEPMLRWCASESFDLTIIETMPLGLVEEDRTDRYLPLDRVQAALAARYTLTPLAETSGGPARYWRVEELGAKLGLITPLTGNFCATCNRVRVSASGTLYLCLGHDEQVDLKAALRSGGRPALDALLDSAMAVKPLRHDFRIDTRDAAPAVSRHMSVTGG
ncbi:GTP 3',8-cyclase MoaA [Sphingomonas jatrophae]|uniref:GTP 3',8-cyclase n=1 Tax=Sphingomonas jatrophae TaxID=1166337 RepID=A0A1I6JM27_9SPHN|nr:GTP 3',8-cyclase MoaA [Sphingomonas jatrophae]SFR80032.1 cyclic pyranopterin monophosphate synthase subunit MoaA [Sphingomonas jatrophae]